MDRDRSFRPRRRRTFDEPEFEPPPRDFGAAPRARTPQFEAPSGPPVGAVVKWFKSDKGFGFVELSDGTGDAFLHATVLGRIGRVPTHLNRPTTSFTAVLLIDRDR